VVKDTSWDGSGAPLGVSREGGQEPQWRPDGRELYFQKLTALDEPTLFSATLTSGDPLRFGTPRRVFVVEVMGRRCGYLALMGGLATGAERVSIHEEGVTLADLQHDLAALVDGFQHGKRLGLVVRGQEANPLYTTPFMYALFEQEEGDLFDVRQAILGDLQQGGDPSPFDRILATRFAGECVDFIVREAGAPGLRAAFIGMREGKLKVTTLEDLPRLMDLQNERPRAVVARARSHPAPPRPAGSVGRLTRVLDASPAPDGAACDSAPAGQDARRTVSLTRSRCTY
jgi:hypothetical protein